MSGKGGKGEVWRHGAVHAGRRQSSELQAPCIPELSQSQEREEFGLLVLHLWPTVPTEGSAYKTAEPNTCGRDHGAKTEGRRVKTVVLRPHCQAEDRSLADPSPTSQNSPHPHMPSAMKQNSSSIRSKEETICSSENCG